MSKKSGPCMVIFNDNQGLCDPYGWDRECKGALTSYDKDTPPVVFPNRQQARKAITVSRRYAELQTAQGEPANTDFIEAVRCIKIVPVDIVKEAAGE
ncbi:hypothetical protein H5P28_11585 [Ruficoccus amylovorans]|uniref:Uncharacterized protein n=1 Tax=Ruficoccus amylovorans TaxID=1804625 RepID=A0A842HF56_9BACT|nr:hypothetical protein [Ruficoccus amylovorans]MBC2594899.1 hypothetical protein [Ruficoccus amylovorans]